MNISDYFPYYRRNLLLAYPVVLSLIGQVTVSLIDNAMVGRVGTIELAAASFANNVFMIGMIFGMGITFGLTPLTGQAYGKGELRQATKWLKSGILSYQVAAVLITLIMLGVYFLLPFLGQTDQVLKAARPYYLWLCASMVPLIAFFTFKQFFEGIGNTRIAMQITLTANAVNVIFNYLFIYGKFGFPELGLIGAGVGTFISRIIMPVLFLWAISQNFRYRRYLVLAHHQVIQMRDILKVLKIGVPIALQLIVEMASFSIGAVMMGWLGEVPLAAHQVAISLASSTYMISLGIAAASTIRVSHQIGNRDFVSMRKAAYASSHLVLAFMLLMGLLFIVFRNNLPLIFSNDEQVIQIAARLLIVAAIFQVFDGLQVVMLGNLRGMADVKIPMIIAFLAYLGLGLPASWFFAFKLNAGAEGIWYGFLVGLGVAGILFFWRFIKNLRNFR
jgi:MATE family multidrug resistance protein